MNAFQALLTRDVRLSFRRGSEGMTGLVFFVIVASLFAIAFGGDPVQIKPLAGGIIWVSALLAALLSLDSLYHRDYEDGTFDLLLQSPVSVVAVVAAKMMAHWLVSGLTFVMASLVVGSMLFIPADVLPVLWVSMLLGTVYMSLIGGLGAILTFGTRRPGLLVTLLILPLMVPMLILGVLATDAALAAMAVKPYILLQLALVVVALTAAPLMAAVILPMQVRST